MILPPTSGRLDQRCCRMPENRGTAVRAATVDLCVTTAQGAISRNSRGDLGWRKRKGRTSSRTRPALQLPLLGSSQDSSDPESDSRIHPITASCRTSSGNPNISAGLSHSRIAVSPPQTDPEVDPLPTGSRRALQQRWVAPPHYGTRFVATRLNSLDRARIALFVPAPRTQGLRPRPSGSVPRGQPRASSGDRRTGLPGAVSRSSNFVVTRFVRRDYQLTGAPLRIRPSRSTRCQRHS